MADFFIQYWKEYLKNPKVPITPEQFRAVNSIMSCLTAALGVDTYACSICGTIKEVYHSCKHRFCPTCSYQDTLKWAEETNKLLIDVPHRHVVFTLPHSLIPLIKRNQRLLYNALQRASAATLRDWILNKYKIDIGVISVFHSFGETKNFHPHAHMLVSWGGLKHQTSDVAIIDAKDYIPYKFLKKKFRIKFEDELISLFDKEELEHTYRSRSHFMAFIKKINENDWIIDIEKPVEDPLILIKYIGRYIKRACISEYKITKMEGGYIAFEYKDYKDRDENNKPKTKEIELHYRDFFPRLLQHVPKKNIQLVKHYGIYANRNLHRIKKLAINRSKPSSKTRNKAKAKYNHCNGAMTYINTYIEYRKTKTNLKQGKKKVVFIRENMMKPNYEL